ncbi:helix-turn-helix transcriptional regulator [candidate division CSSED10-310 bacterium]|uniref:Helix-turn-helix transcriptional regulator n=1 Tax=candidate division CSSED10-310 bacterium TaxID=2855610 RepID=A0ABV6YRJ3_UNCC1
MVRSAHNSRRYYTISVVAKMLDIHQQTLRIYEKEGLIKPARTKGNTRLYTADDIEKIRFVLRLTNDLGVNLAGVGVILELQQQMKEMELEFDLKLHQIVEEMTKHFYNYLQNNSCLPVRSYKKSLIIQHKGNINSSL